jgi:hypothetical protein
VAELAPDSLIPRPVATEYHSASERARRALYDSAASPFC